MEIESGEGQLQIHLRTKQKQFAVPDIPYSIGANVSITDLNILVNTLLNENIKTKQVEFDFLVFEEYLRTKLGEHLINKNISFEDIIEIEYFEKFPSPQPKDCLLHDDWVSAVQTCDKLILTGCYDNTINIWTVRGEHIMTTQCHTKPIKAVAWISLNKDNATFISCSQDQSAVLWYWVVNKGEPKQIHNYQGHERGIDCVDINPELTKFATGSWDTMIKIWDIDFQEDMDYTSNEMQPTIKKIKTPIMTLQGHRECVSGVKWLNNDTLLSCSWDHTIKLWDLNLQGIKSEFVGNKAFFDISYSKLNELIVTASADKNIRLYDSKSNQGTVIKSTFIGHTQWVQSVCWSKESEYHFVSGSYDSKVKLWDIRSPKAPLYDLTGHDDRILDCDWSNSKYIVSGGEDNTVKIFKSSIFKK